ncbi:MAG: hypothetical protein ACI9SQ_000248 [Rubritalea sp.]|jgi:hypothetical protein
MTLPPNASSISPPTYHAGKVLFHRVTHIDVSQVWRVDAVRSDTHLSTPYATQWNRYEASTEADGKVWGGGSGLA